MAVIAFAGVLAVVPAGPAAAQGDSEPSAAQRCFEHHKFGQQPVDVAKTADGQTVLAQVSWGYLDSIGCYLTLDDTALAALRAAPAPQSLPTAETEASKHCFEHHKFGQQPVDVAKTADGQTVLARLNWGHHDTIGCYLTLDNHSLNTLRTASAVVDRPAPEDSPYQRLLYGWHSDATGVITLATVNVDGSNHQQRLTFEKDNLELRWSPDRSRFAYTDGDTWGGDGDAWVANADGSNARKVSIDARFPAAHARLHNPEWSPDGRYLELRYDTNRSDQHGLVLVEVDGTNSIGGTIDLGENFAGYYRWSPDGTRLAYLVLEANPNNDKRWFERLELWIANTDGSNRRQQVAVGVNPYMLSGGAWQLWSPDSAYLFYFDFRVDLDGTVVLNNLRIANADGAHIREVPGLNLGSGAHNLWSPDGTRFVFPGGGGDNLQLVDADFTNIRRLNGASPGAFNYWWSPDGASLLYYKSNGSLMMVDGDGTNPRRICDACRNTGGPGYNRWSPDGTRLLHLSDSDVWIANSDGTNPRRLLVGLGGKNLRAIRWSPDSSRLLYLDRGEATSPSGGLWITTVDGAIRRKVADDAFEPSWSPAGTHLLYRVRNDWSLWIAEADGTNPRRIDTGSGDVERISWSPDGAYFVYTVRTDTDTQLWGAQGDGTNHHQLLTIPSDDPEDPWNTLLRILAWLD